MDKNTTQQRQEQRAKALRENLLKRKAQQRGRTLPCGNPKDEMVAPEKNG